MSRDPGRVQGEAQDAQVAHQRPLLADRYRLDAVIGRGGMGQVWRGWDELLGRAVAVKELRGMFHDEVATTRFSLEARTAAQLNDPHVVAVYDFGADQERLYLVMELVPGHSLAQELETAVVLDAPRAADLCAQVAAGLAAAHRHGVVHRDIKPGNLLLDEQGKVSIADFGIAHFTQETTTTLALTANGQIIGTVAYLSPERALGRPATSASDVYALGCVLYHVLTGGPPFTADLPAATLYQHVHREPEPPHHLNPAVPPSLSQYVLRLLAKDPAERPTAAQAQNWLRQWTPNPTPTTSGIRAFAAPDPREGPALAPGAAEPPPTTRPRSRRYRLLVAGTAAAALGAATVGILSLSGPTGHPARPPSTAASPHRMSAPATTRVAQPAASTTSSPRPVPRRQPATSGTASSPPATSLSVAHATTPEHGSSQHDRKPKKPKKPKK